MGKILIPAESAEDWRVFLAEPDKQWKTGYSAKSLAYCWQEAGGVPQEVQTVLDKVPALMGLKTIFAIPEHKVPLPGGRTESQNDVWVLGETKDGLVSIAVEGKVSEPFGETVGEWSAKLTPGKETRLQFLCKEIGIDYPPPNNIRYQLLHRTASAIIEAKRFRTKEAAMVVHTFSKTNEWLNDFQAFVSLYDLSCGVDEIVSTTVEPGINLHLAWVHGSERYLEK